MGNHRSRLKAWENAPQKQSVVYGVSKPRGNIKKNNGKHKQPTFFNLEEVTKETECFYCECELNNKNKTRDHVKPKMKGHSLSKHNKVWSCVACNSHKSSMTLIEWKEKLLELNLKPSTKGNRLHVILNKETIIKKIDYLLSVL